METIKEIAEMKKLSGKLREGGGVVVFVPTMGALHPGHLSLIEKARTLGTKGHDALHVVVSVFVNPIQFGLNEDYAKYPRDTEKDSVLAEKAGTDVFFSPCAEDMYPERFSTYAEVGLLSEKLCGASRPGHFRGVTTVVLKLLNIVMPHKAVFGLKDYQQQLIIKKMVDDLNMDVEIATADTVRESDGLAMSSRNRYLSDEERSSASSIPRSLECAKKSVLNGVGKSSEIVEEVKKIMEKESPVVIDYIKVCDPVTLDDMDEIRGQALLALAVRIGRTRLIDNCLLEVRRSKK